MSCRQIFSRIYIQSTLIDTESERSSDFPIINWQPIQGPLLCLSSKHWIYHATNPFKSSLIFIFLIVFLRIFKLMSFISNPSGNIGDHWYNIWHHLILIVIQGPDIVQFSNHLYWSATYPKVGPCISHRYRGRVTLSVFVAHLKLS